MVAVSDRLVTEQDSQKDRTQNFKRDVAEAPNDASVVIDRSAVKTAGRGFLIPRSLRSAAA